MKQPSMAGKSLRAMTKSSEKPNKMAMQSTQTIKRVSNKGSRFQLPPRIVKKFPSSAQKKSSNATQSIGTTSPVKNINTCAVLA